MRSSKSRSRSKANRPRTLGNIVNRVFDSSGPEGKVRGTPAQIIEKYQFLARDAQLANDRVAAENFLQHAEHYTRMLAEAMREMQAEQDARQQQYGQQGQGGGQGQPGQQGYQGGNGNGGNGGNGGNRDGNRDYQRDGNRDGQRDGNRDGQREPRYDQRRDDRYDRSAEAASGLGPVIGAEDDGEAGPVPTPEAASAEPRFDRPRNDQQRNENSRGENPRSDQPRGDQPRENREPRFNPQGGEGQGGNQQRRAPRPYPPRARSAQDDQPGLPSFITDPITPVAAEPAPVEAAPEPVAAAAEKPKAAPRPRKPAAPKVASEAVAAEPKSGE